MGRSSFRQKFEEKINQNKSISFKLIELCFISAYFVMNLI